ncbi:MAG: malectin, partial [Chitinophagaceae bacterium]|nr:malectin [Anaerolineae bacterium]
SNTPIPSETPEPSNTPIPSETPIPSTAPTQTSTPTATGTSTTTATPTATFTPSATIIAEPTLMYRINAGGSLITFGGVAWNADANFSGGRNSTMTGAIAGTTNDALYYQSRVSDADTSGFSYNFPVANGNYTVNLHFAEIYWVGGSGRGQAGANRRVFDVQLEGALVIDNLDLYATAGPLRAYVRTFTANVTDGNLSINFPRATVNRPIISAIEVFQNSTTNLLLSGVNTSQRITAPTSTLIPSATVISLATFTPTFTATATFLPTLTVSATRTPTATVTATSTPTTTQTPLPTLAPSLTPKPIIPPSANAGEDQTIIDVDSDGSEIVVLNGLNSIDTDGTITAASWTREGIEIGVGLNPSVTLPIGVHTITLTVTDDSGAIATDTVTVTIAAPPAQ